MCALPISGHDHPTYARLAQAGERAARAEDVGSMQFFAGFAVARDLAGRQKCAFARARALGDGGRIEHVHRLHGEPFDFAPRARSEHEFVPLLFQHTHQVRTQKAGRAADPKPFQFPVPCSWNAFWNVNKS